MLIHNERIIMEKSWGLYRSNSGKTYEVVESSTEVSFSPVNGTRSRPHKGSRDFKTRCGLDLNFEKNGFSIVLTDDFLTKVEN